MPEELIISPDVIVPAAERNSCGESPFWSAMDNSFQWVDIPAKRIHRWRLGESACDTWQLAEQAGCIARQSGGGVLAACESGLFSVTLEATPGVTLRAAFTHPAEGMRFNDGKCDRAGNLWVSNFMMSADKRPVGALFRYTKEGLSAPKLDGFMTPNGMAFSPDNRTLYISDSHTAVRKVWAMNFDLDSGALGERRMFVDMAQYKGRPDGASIDTDGCYWVAGIDDGCIMRFTPSGKLDRILRLPVKYPTMCAFGGADMKTMFVTSLQRAGAEAAADPLGGSVLCFEVQAQGIPEVAFAGF